MRKAKQFGNLLLTPPLTFNEQNDGALTLGKSKQCSRKSGFDLSSLGLLYVGVDRCPGQSPSCGAPHAVEIPVGIAHDPNVVPVLPRPGECLGGSVDARIGTPRGHQGSPQPPLGLGEEGREFVLARIHAAFPPRFPGGYLLAHNL
jgi:hypothetical protein